MTMIIPIMIMPTALGAFIAHIMDLGIMTLGTTTHTFTDTAQCHLALAMVLEDPILDSTMVIHPSIMGILPITTHGRDHIMDMVGMVDIMIITVMDMVMVLILITIQTENQEYPMVKEEVCREREVAMEERVHRQQVLEIRELPERLGMLMIPDHLI